MKVLSDFTVLVRLVLVCLLVGFVLGLAVAVAAQAHEPSRPEMANVATR